MPSSLITVLARHCEDGNEPCPSVEPHEVASLSQVLAAVPDPRRVRGCRYRLGVLLALCLTAVLGGARSLAQIARYAAGADPEVRAGLGFTRAAPNASTLGRLLAASTATPWTTPSAPGSPATPPTPSRRTKP